MSHARPTCYVTFVARPRKHQTDAERQREYRARKKREEAAGAVHSAETPLSTGTTPSAPAKDPGDPSAQEVAAPSGQRGDLDPSPPPDEPLPAEVVLTPDTDEAYLRTAEAMQQAYQDGYDGIAYPSDTPVELAVAWARGVWQRQANSQPVRADQAERDQRAREYAEWLKAKVDPPLPSGPRTDPHGPDLKPELAKQAAKASKHPGGWDG